MKKQLSPSVEREFGKIGKGPRCLQLSGTVYHWCAIVGLLRVETKMGLIRENT